ncbi:MAG: mucoidy inhibitor MuiA family protein, partial [Bacteroidota bacterium]
MHNISSTITGVTVYPNQAEIERSAEIQLEAGHHELVFSDLTAKLNPRSVQVLASDNLWLFDIRTERQQLEVSGHPKLKVFREEEERLQQAQKNQLSRQARLQEQKKLVLGLGNRLTTATEKSHEAEWAPDNWQKLMQFYSQQLERLDIELLQLDKELIDTQKKLDQVRRQIQSLGKQGPQGYCVRLKVELQSENTVQLGLKYLVNDASWQPQYDLRVNGQEEKLQCVYKAQVQQNTGEDWNGVGLALSTSQPSISGNPPKLRPQVVRPRPKPKPVSRSLDADMDASLVRSSGPKKSRSRSRSIPAEAMIEEISAPMPQAKRKESSVEAGILATTFALEGEFDVPTDGQG